MDRERFDALAKLLATTGSRRAVLGALLGGGPLVRHPSAAAKPGKGKGKGKRKGKRPGDRDSEEVTVCHSGETLRVPRSAVEGILLDDGALGPCPTFALGGRGPCTGRNDCPDVPCRTKACADGACVYTPVGDGPSPNGLCDTHCCGITCCASAAAVCFQGRCCVPSGPLDCGRDRCSDACPGCEYCVTFADGSSGCANGAPGFVVSCQSPCTDPGTCPFALTFCISSYTDRRTAQTVTVGEHCANPSLRSACAGFARCRPS